MSDDPAVQEWIIRAKERDILEVAQEHGATLKRVGGEWIGPCPVCGGDDRFAIQPREQVFNCRGHGGGGVVDLVMHICGAGFMEAVEVINGTPSPGRDASPPRPIDRDAARARQESQRDKELLRGQTEATEYERKAHEAQQLFDQCRAIQGTHAEAYLRLRGIHLYGDVATDLRFHPALDYWHDGKCFGAFPAMCAAIRLPDGRLIGVHRTYLDPKHPIKLDMPHIPVRKAKKVRGHHKRGAIYFGAVRPVMAIGEGIETTLAWSMLDHGALDFGIACAVNLGNLAGGWTDSVKRPDNSTIPNGIPNMERPGIRLPDDVEEVILLGDRDIDMANVRGHLLTAGRRFVAEGKRVMLHFPDAIGGRKTDWADHLLAQTRKVAA